MAPEISVIIPVYNADKWLHRCVDSILAQRFTDFEVLLVDDGSTDSSGAICDEYATIDSRVRVFHKPNGGVSSSRNYGLERAVGQWITYVDSDDWIEYNYLEFLITKAIKTDSDIVFSDFWFDYPESKVIGYVYDWSKQGIKGLKEYISSSWNCLWGSLQRKKLYDENKLKLPLAINYCEDFHLMVKLCFFAKTISKVPLSLYHYRQQESSIIHNLNKKTEADEQWVYSDIIFFLQQHGIYHSFEQVMAWRSLKASQELALDINTFDKFCLYNPVKKKYIFKCPYIGLKLKIITWCLTHGLRSIAVFIVRMRKILRR